MRLAGFRERLIARARVVDITLADTTVDRIEIYYRLLEHWNRKINLTALPLESMSDNVIDRMLIEPLVAADAVPPTPLRWWDLGSGGGSPAFPIKLLRPMAALTLVEARSRKAAFLREAVRELQLAAVDVCDGRFEEVAGRVELAGVADVVTVRAVRIDDALFESSWHLLKSSAELMLFNAKRARIPTTPRFNLDRRIDLIPKGTSELVVLRANN